MLAAPTGVGVPVVSLICDFIGCVLCITLAGIRCFPWVNTQKTFAAQRHRQEAAPAVAKRLSMRRLATLSHTRRGGVSGAQLLALQGHNHTSERVD